MNSLISSEIFGTTLECHRNIDIDPSYKTTDLEPETGNIIKKCFPVNFLRFLTTYFRQINSGLLLMTIILTDPRKLKIKKKVSRKNFSD